LPHPPQFCGSVVAFTHADPQAICGGVQDGEIVPLGPDFEQAASRKT